MTTRRDFLKSFAALIAVAPASALATVHRLGTPQEWVPSRRAPDGWVPVYGNRLAVLDAQGNARGFAIITSVRGQTLTVRSMPSGLSSALTLRAV